MSGYIGASPLTQAVQKRQSFTATSGQTVFSFSYQPGYLDVFLNGVKMRDTEDYVATNGTSVTFNTGITLGGEVDLVTLSNFTPHDSYFKAESDARYEPIDSAYTKSEADARYLQSVASDSIGADELNVSGNGTAGQYLGSDGDGTMTWTSISSDPTMGGDLSGTASNAQIVANAVGTSEIANSAVTDAKISGMSSSKLSGALPAIDGSALTNLPGGSSPATSQVFTVSGTWTKPTDCQTVRVTVIGGGGGGGGCYSNNGYSMKCGGGGGGGYATKIIDVSGISSVSVTVGSAGTGGSGNYNTSDAGFAGSSGGTSSFGTHVSATGGAGGGGGARWNGSSGSAGATNEGTGTNGDLNIKGGSTLSASWWSGGAEGGSLLGVRGGDHRTSNGAGSSAESGAYGCGGGGAYCTANNVTYTGGAGHQGIIVVEEFY